VIISKHRQVHATVASPMLLVPCCCALCALLARGWLHCWPVAAGLACRYLRKQLTCSRAPGGRSCLGELPGGC
jgi:hypothetical protein